MIIYSICLCLTYFTRHNTLQVHPCCCKWQNFILFYDWVGSIPLCVRVCVTPHIYPFICWWAPVAPTFWLLLLPYFGHWHACIFLNECFYFLQIYTWVVLLDHMVILFLVVYRTSILFSTLATSIYIPTDSVRGFSFLYILANICYLWSFWW